MSAELIYRTSSPAALAWRLAYTERWVECKVAWDAFEFDVEAALGIPEGEQHRSLYMVDGQIVGIVRTSDEWADRRNYGTRFPGWKEHQRWPILTPKLNTKAGKEWQAKLAALPVLSLRTEARQIGVPDYILTDGRMFSGGFDYDEDDEHGTTAIYQVWGSGECERACLAEQAKHPEIEWVEVPRSAWYARLEALEAQKEPA